MALIPAADRDEVDSGFKDSPYAEVCKYAEDCVVVGYDQLVVTVAKFADSVEGAGGVNPDVGWAGLVGEIEGEVVGVVGGVYDSAHERVEEDGGC